MMSFFPRLPTRPRLLDLAKMQRSILVLFWGGLWDELEVFVITE